MDIRGVYRGLMCRIVSHCEKCSSASLRACVGDAAARAVQVKCDQYWPTRSTENYGVMHVTLVDVVELATYTIRTFLLTRVCHSVTHPSYRSTA